jgi:hypothetical protein
LHFGTIIKLTILKMANKIRTNLFVPGDKIGRRDTEGINQVRLEIDYVDYSREVYVFVLPWIYQLTKNQSFRFSVVEELFKKIE